MTLADWERETMSFSVTAWLCIAGCVVLRFESQTCHGGILGFINLFQLEFKYLKCEQRKLGMKES